MRRAIQIVSPLLRPCKEGARDALAHPRLTLDEGTD